MVWGNMSTGQWLATVGGAGGAVPFWQVLGRKALTTAGDTITVLGDETTLGSGTTPSSWTESDSNSRISESSGTITFSSLTREATVASISTDLGANTVNASKWTVRFQINFSAIANDSQINFYLSDTQNASSATNQNAIGFSMYAQPSNPSWVSQIGWADGEALGTSNLNSNSNYTVATSTDYYVEFCRISTTRVRMIVRTGSHTGTTRATWDITNADIANVSEDIRYLTFANATGYNQALSCVVSNVTFHNDSAIYEPDLEAKPYLMIIPHVYDVGTNQVYGAGTFNSDGGSTYANRWSRNGGSDTTNNSQTSMVTYFAGAAYGEFGILTVNNQSDQEKILISSGGAADATGAGTAPKRHEGVHKWANTSDSIKSFTYTNGGSGDFAIGSEVVVLGYDPADESGTNAWEELANVTLGSAGDNLSSGTFTAKKYLLVQAFMEADNSITGNITFNGSTSGYARRRSNDGASDSTDTSASAIDVRGGESKNRFETLFIINKSDKEKLVIGEMVTTATGAGTAPNRTEYVAKWDNTSSQITSINFANSESGGNYNTNSSIKVWGFD